MKLSKLFSETILPISIGTLIFFGSFALIIENIDYKKGLNQFTIVFLLTVLFSSIYQIMIGNWFSNRNKNKLIFNIFNCLVFATFFTIILIFINLLSVQPIEWDFFIVIYFALFVLELLFLTIITILKKFILKN
jgi:hypothetical protein